MSDGTSLKRTLLVGGIAASLKKFILYWEVNSLEVLHIKIYEDMISS